MKRIVVVLLCSLLVLSGVSAMSDEWVDCSAVLQLDTKYPYGDTTSMGISLGYSKYVGYLLGYATYTDIIYAPWKSGTPIFASETAGLSGQLPLSNACSLFTSVGPALEVSVVDHDESSATRTDSIFQFGLGAVLGARATLSSDIGAELDKIPAKDKDTEKNAFSVAGFAGVTLGIGSSYDPAPGSLSPYYHY